MNFVYSRTNELASKYSEVKWIPKYPIFCNVTIMKSRLEFFKSKYWWRLCVIFKVLPISITINFDVGWPLHQLKLRMWWTLCVSVHRSVSAMRILPYNCHIAWTISHEGTKVNARILLNLFIYQYLMKFLLAFNK